MSRFWKINLNFWWQNFLKRIENYQFSETNYVRNVLILHRLIIYTYSLNFLRKPYRMIKLNTKYLSTWITDIRKIVLSTKFLTSFWWLPWNDYINFWKHVPGLISWKNALPYELAACKIATIKLSPKKLHQKTLATISRIPSHKNSKPSHSPPL